MSELLVGLIAGPQDKKKSLDEYFENYDSEMPEKAQWVDQFESTVELIKKTLTPEQIRTWSGKSDFYTLFLAMGGLVDKKPGPSDRKAIQSALTKIRAAIDAGKKMDAAEIKPKDVAVYVDAVTRAATDRKRRELRLRVLEDRIAKALE